MSEQSIYEELRQKIKRLEDELASCRKSEQSVLESEEKFRLLYERAPLGYQSLDVNGHFLEVNQSWLNVLGYSREEVVGRSFGDFLHPDWVDHFKENFPRFKALGEVVGVEFEMVKKDGSLIMVQFNGKISHDENGRFKQTHCVLQDISEQRRVLEALRKSEKRFRAIFEQAAVGVAQIEAKTGRFVKTNNKYGDILGYTLEEMSATTFMAIIHPDDQQVINKKMKDLSGGKIQEFSEETRCICKDGSTVWVHLAVSPKYEGREKINYHIAVVQDITDRKQAKEALRRIEWLLTRSAKKKRTNAKDLVSDNADIMIKGAGNMLIQAAGEEVLQDVTEDYLDLLETSVAVFDAIGDYALGTLTSGWCRFLHHASRNLCGTDDEQEAMESGQWHCHESCWTEASKVSIETGQPVDIQCRGGLRIYAVPIQAGDEIVGSINFGYGDPPTDIKEIEQIARKFDVGTDVLLQLANQLESRPPFIIEIAKNRLQTSAKLLGEIVGRKQSEEEKIKLEVALRQAQKMEAIGTLAGGIAHDFNNILAAISGFTELALDETSEGSLLQDNLKEVLVAAGRAKDLARQILTFSRQSDQEKKPISVKLIAREALKLLRASLPSSINIEQEIQSDSLVLGDQTQIHQILMNLCTNAGQAMTDKGGTLTIQLVNKELDKAFTAKHPGLNAGAFIQMTVSDTGSGMSHHVMERIYDPFFTTKKEGEGTGMGLSVVHGIVKSHGGTITVYSEPDIGTTFNVFLPVLETDKAAQIINKEIIIPGTERILFVDDELALVKMGSQLLESLGYKVTVRTSGIEALELFKVQPDQFDLVVTDMTMPNMTGDELAKALMDVRSDIPVIICSGFSTKMDNTKAKALGIREFIYKPFLKSDVARAIRSALDTPNERLAKSSKRILIIEDDEQVKTLLSQILTHDGYEVIQTSNGDEGVKRFRNNPTDLVITDLIMPAKEGLETIIELKRNYPEVKIIAISGGGINSPEPYLSMAEQFGAVRTLPKPIDSDLLLRTISECLMPN